MGADFSVVGGEGDVLKEKMYKFVIMKKSKKAIQWKLIFLFLVLQTNSYTQNKFSTNVELSVGASSAIGQNIKYESWKGSTNFSGKTGVNFQYAINEKIAIRSGMGFNYIENETESVEIREELDGRTRIYNNETKFNLFYFSIPLSCTYKVGNGGFNIGIQTLFLKHHKKRRIISIYIPNPSSNLLDSYQVRIINHNVKNFDLGPQAGFFYRIGEKTTLKVDAYLGLLNVSTETNVDRKNSQFTLGLEFNL